MLGGWQREAEPTESWAAFWFSCFSICPQGGTLLLYLLNMYASYWSWGSHYISTVPWMGDNGGPVFLFLYLGLSATLIYLSAQLVQIASSIIGTRYENVDPRTRAQTRCYECNLEASWGRPSSKVKVGGGVSQGQESYCASLVFL